ncbi:KAT8 regulatory NSL complex subunit 1 isoform 2-T5 [Clarias gariepinus]|uniref:KAT8 regulatory NSL complex subunit 1 isoform X2 n=1 Tax=Clarias gariepinus TaxID=13013 RepID=UPI00234DE1B7|nr:KAT8 regulatory NSL complex subunit 1 isoform X2 [Clarias gariepinus]
MAAMAPALTDTPADTHRIRLKLAPSSSAINSSAVEENGAAGRVLVPTNGTVKRKTSSDKEDHLSCAARTFSKEESGRDLGKIQQLVTSYRCSDETLKLQNVFDILPGFLQRKHDTLELSEEQLKSIMSAGNGSGLPSFQQSASVNGMARRFTKASKDSNSVTMNGGRHGQGAIPLAHGGPTRDPTGQHQCPRGVPRDRPNNRDIRESSTHFYPPLQVPDRSPSLTVDVSLPPLQPLASPGGDMQSRSQQAESRHLEIEGRLQRLRKRLQVVQAKQVERHVQQQLGGLLHCTLGPQDARVHPERVEASRFLRGASAPSELERLSLGCSTHLRAAESAFDSDATESSSGGETDVEKDELARADVEQRHIPLWRRAEGRYAVERSSIISHWNWLQAHVSDLEYRIRQHTDIYRHIRLSKGAVVLGEGSACPTETSSSSLSRTESLSCPQVPDADGTDGSVSAFGVSMETNLRKSYPSVRHVNGVINSMRCGSPAVSEAEQQRLGAADPTCVAARTRPLVSCRRRRLIRPSTLSHLNNKMQQGRWCGCDVSSQCVMCCSRPAPPSHTPFQRPLLDRLAQLDPCVHPVLSFTDDVGMGLHLQRVMKCHWQGRPLDKIKPIKKLSLKHPKFSPSGRLIDPSPSASSSCPKDKLKLSSSLFSTVRLSHHRMRSDKLYRHQQSDGESRQLYRAERSHTRKRPREHSLERDNVSKVYMEVTSPSSSLTTPTLSPVVRQLSSTEISTPCSLTTTPAQRKRRVESSFDINNIVIPMSVAATTRVEKLQYKEILTPSWREVNITAKRISEEDDEVEIEDLSDAMFSQLHLPCEDQERSRWTWTSSSVAKRRGSRSYKSVDGRSTPLLGGTTPSTPQPSSPDPSHFPLLQDYSSAPSPSPSSPASPELLTLSHMHTPASRDSHRLLSSEDTRCSTPDTSYDETPVLPWERRTFPLDAEPAPDQQLQEQQASPGGDRTFRTARRISGCRSGSRSECEGEPPSPLAEDAGRHRSNSYRHTHC